MTTIAYRDGILASDSLGTANGLRDSILCTKIFRIGPCLVAGAGSAAKILKFVDWVKNGLDPETLPFTHEDDANGMLVTPAGKIIMWSEQGPWPVESPFYALGSGYQIAMGAMEMGATAAEAVEAAIKWDTGSGGPVRTLAITR